VNNNEIRIEYEKNTDSNTEYTLMVSARSQEEALKICSTVTFVEEQG
jgi:hypothetical protein